MHLGPENGGEGGIRTHEGLSPLPVFKTGAFNRSATSPEAAHYPASPGILRTLGLWLKQKPLLAWTLL